MWLLCLYYVLFAFFPQKVQSSSLSDTFQAFSYAIVCWVADWVIQNCRTSPTSTNGLARSGELIWCWFCQTMIDSWFEHFTLLGSEILGQLNITQFNQWTSNFFPIYTKQSSSVFHYLHPGTSVLICISRSSYQTIVLLKTNIINPTFFPKIFSEHLNLNIMIFKT